MNYYFSTVVKVVECAMCIHCLAGLAQNTSAPKERPATVIAEPTATENTIATLPYKDLANEHGLYKLPDGLAWEVHPEYRASDPKHNDPRLTLVLNDQKQKFWPVVSKMDLAAAEKLHADLGKAIADKKKGTATP